MQCMIRRMPFLGVLLVATLCAACTGGGNFSFLGYTSRPPFPDNIRTVYVPVFQNRAFQSGPLRGLEFELTKSVQRQIEHVSNYKVVSYREGADTELLGTVVLTQVNLVNRNPLNEIREGELAVQIELVWRDLRTGEILSKPQPGPGGQPLRPTDPHAPPPPVVIRTTGRYLPELGESQVTALKQACDKIAVDIVSLMESPW